MRCRPEQPAQGRREERARQQLEQLLDQRGAAKHQCDSISREDPHAAVEQAQAALEIAQAEHQAHIGRAHV